MCIAGGRVPSRQPTSRSCRRPAHSPIVTTAAACMHGSALYTLARTNRSIDAFVIVSDLSRSMLVYPPTHPPTHTHTHTPTPPHRPLARRPSRCASGSCSSTRRRRSSSSPPCGAPCSRASAPTSRPALLSRWSERGWQRRMHFVSISFTAPNRSVSVRSLCLVVFRASCVSVCCVCFHRDRGVPWGTL